MPPQPTPRRLAPAVAVRPRGRGTVRALARLAAHAAATLTGRLWRALLWPRPQGIADLDDHLLRDIGLTRADVPRHRTGGAREAEAAAMLRRGGGW